MVIVFCKISSDRWHGLVQRGVHDGLGLYVETFHQLLVIAVHLRFQTIGLIHPRITYVVVNMSMGDEQVLGLELLLFNILSDGLALSLILGTAVDDGGLLCLVAYNIAIFLNVVADKSLNVQHNLLK